MASPAYALCRIARDRAGLTQRQLAARAGVSPSTVARVERGRMEPTLDLLLRLVDACGLDLRMRLTEIDHADRPGTDPVDFASRLESLRKLSDLAVELRAGR